MQLNTSKTIYILFVLSLSLYSCSSLKTVAKPNDFKHHIHGMIVQVNFSEDDIVWKEKGELIAIDDSLLTFINYTSFSPDSSLIMQINKQTIQKVIIFIHKNTNNPGAIIAWSAVLVPLTATHGFYAVVSAPIAFINLIVQSAIAGGHKVTVYPKSIDWLDMKKLARFPQGIPKGINLQDIK